MADLSLLKPTELPLLITNFYGDARKRCGLTHHQRFVLENLVELRLDRDRASTKRGRIKVLPFLVWRIGLRRVTSSVVSLRQRGLIRRIKPRPNAFSQSYYELTLKGAEALVNGMAEE